MDNTGRAFNKPAFALFSVCSLAAVFCIPYFIPQQPTVSLSWIFGYNNRAALFILLIALAIGLLWTGGISFASSLETPMQPLPRWLLWCSLLAMLAACIAVYMAAGPIEAHPEPAYQIERIWLLAKGEKPYIDFEFPYGPLLLYGPEFLQRLGHLNVAQGYCLFWLLSSLTGVFLLFEVISGATYPARGKGAIYLTLLVPALIASESLGSNYTLFRFASPLYFIFVFQRLLVARRSMPRLAASSLGFTLILLLISPEIAFAFAFACLLLLLISINKWKLGDAAWLGALIIALGCEFLLALRLHLLDTLLEDGGGADSIPIAFAPHILLYIASAFVCLQILSTQIRQRLFQDSNLGLVVISIPLMAAALGRCDPSHVFWNGLGIFTATMLYLSRRAVAARRYRLLFVSFVVILPGLGGYAMAKLSQHTRAAAPPRIAPQVALDALYPNWHGDFLVPFGFVPNGVATYSSRIDYGHFDRFVNHNTESSINRSIEEMRSQPQKALLLTADFQGNCQNVNAAGLRAVVSFLFGFPYLARAVHTQSPRKPVCDFIVQNYVMVQAPDSGNFHYGLWVRKTQPGTRLGASPPHH